MRLWQRLVATLLLMIFVPASLAAALPLVYCYGADGHRGFELVEGSPDFTVRQTYLVVEDADHHGTSVTTRGGCVDVEVVCLTSLTQRGADGKAVPSKAPRGKSSYVASGHVRWPSLSDMDITSGPRPPVVIDRLAQRCTVVLLI
jgi:hypothetical protein